MASSLLPCYGVGLKSFSLLHKSGVASGAQAQLGHPLALRSSRQRRRGGVVERRLRSAGLCPSSFGILMPTISGTLSTNRWFEFVPITCLFKFLVEYLFLVWYQTSVWYQISVWIYFYVWLVDCSWFQSCNLCIWTFETLYAPFSWGKSFIVMNFQFGLSHFLFLFLICLICRTRCF